MHQNVGEKENVAPQNKFNTSRQGHGTQQQHEGNDTRLLGCWTCGEEHLKRYCPHNHGGRPMIYSAQETQTNGDVG